VKDKKKRGEWGEKGTGYWKEKKKKKGAG